MPRKLPAIIMELMKDICKGMGGYQNILDEIENAEFHEMKPHRQIKHVLWELTGYWKLI